MNKNNNDQNVPFQFFPNKEQPKFFKRIFPVSVYDFYITGDIEEPEHYIDLIQALRTAEPQDTIFMYLNTNGGNLHTTIQILSAMRSSAASVVTCLEGQVCSAGTFIFLKGDKKIVNPNCTFMIHNYSQASSGRAHEVMSQIGYMEKYFETLAQDIYGDFLSEEELRRVFSGEDLWMQSAEVVAKLQEHEHDFIYTGNDEDLDVQIDVKPIKTGRKKVSKKTSVKRSAKDSDKKPKK